MHIDVTRPRLVVHNVESIPRVGVAVRWDGLSPIDQLAEHLQHLPDSMKPIGVRLVDNEDAETRDDHTPRPVIISQGGSEIYLAPGEFLVIVTSPTPALEPLTPDTIDDYWKVATS